MLFSVFSELKLLPLEGPNLNTEEHRGPQRKIAPNIPLDNSRYNDYCAVVMAGVIARELKQHTKFASREQEVVLGLRMATARIVEPWEKFLKA